ncbi:quinone-dependent dihydroorotate dehydrogenase [Candidatus Woesebacteria bacterium]|nr:quinone-dependent dihydroorotate dehydrogenase [Candidatus Woesebacteria bacterium]
MSQKRQRLLIGFILTLIIVGILDTAYLTLHYLDGSISSLSCSVGIFSDCGRVLTSVYSRIFGIPLAVIGLVYYTILLQLFIFSHRTKKTVFIYGLFLVSTIGLLASIYFMYLQLFVLKTLCLMCSISALTSFLLYLCIRIGYWRAYQALVLKKIELLYRYIVKPIFFTINPEFLHERFLHLGATLGASRFLTSLTAPVFRYKNKTLAQKLHGVSFPNPIGLSAGYDYEARWARFSGSVGFGFTTVGTISNLPFAGNKKPRLGRLPRSKALLANKGFRNPGAKEVIKRLQGKAFDIPVGISIGRTNRADIDTQKLAIADIVAAFEQFESSRVQNAYYELNISCPNLKKGVDFYALKDLAPLLKAVQALKIKQPIFVKMPIDKTDKHSLNMVEAIHKHHFAGVIFGNLQKDRNHPSLVPQEVARMGKGNFSGKPTYERSNELILATYRAFKKDITIVGCGGIFSAQDAYEKIIRGASLLQLITGMIYEGPQCMTQINRGLVDLLKKNGFSYISQAVGSMVQK